MHTTGRAEGHVVGGRGSEQGAVGRATGPRGGPEAQEVQVGPVLRGDRSAGPGGDVAPGFAVAVGASDAWAATPSAVLGGLGCGAFFGARSDEGAPGTRVELGSVAAGGAASGLGVHGSAGTGGQEPQVPLVRLCGVEAVAPVVGADELGTHARTVPDGSP
ncbi:hypothetical protein RGQ21_00190 [Kitasatospora aureofaciens]|nr:hypothetical protein RGQ21_00190 [Kitasatospora aureofaciens]